MKYGTPQRFANTLLTPPSPIMDGESCAGYSAGRHDVSPVNIELVEEKTAETI